jgi:hypothetical protein
MEEPAPEPPGGRPPPPPAFYGIWPRLPEVELNDPAGCAAPYPSECRLPEMAAAR